MTDWQPLLASSAQTASSVRQIVDGATERWFFIVPVIVVGLLTPLILPPALRLRRIATIWAVLTSLFGR